MTYSRCVLPKTVSGNTAAEFDLHASIHPISQLCTSPVWGLTLRCRQATASPEPGSKL